jgi:sulfur relay (sulfurtransferase) DsrC/TusE family protein
MQDADRNDALINRIDSRFEGNLLRSFYGHFQISPNIRILEKFA